MIPSDTVVAWAVQRPWPTPEQVEQDLLLSRAICAIADHPYLGEELAFRGGTAFHKLHLAQPLRYSEDLTVQGGDVLAQIARELVAVMRRDVRTDWTVRDDVRAKLRSSIKRLLVKYKYPPDKQPDAIKLVMDQMESMAPRYADDRRSSS